MTVKRPILTDRAPIPAGHYSQAIVHAGLVYVSGQLPIIAGVTPARVVDGGIEAQTKQALAHVEAILLAAGSDASHVLRTTVYVTDVAHWPAVNRAYGEFFAARTSVMPARTIVPSGPLHHGALIEIDAIAAVKA